MEYLIKKGDNLTKIAKTFGTTVDALVKANKIKNKNLIYAGKYLTIPSTSTPAPATTEAAPVYDAPVSNKQPEVTSPPPSPTAAELGVVKTPSRDVTRIQDLMQGIPAEEIAQLVYEQLSAIEIAQIETSSTIDGVRQQYSIISNLSDIRKRYNATKELTIMDKLAPLTGIYLINLDSKIPGESYILLNNLDAEYSYLDENDVEATVKKDNLYIDTNGDLVIEFDNILDNEIIQVQIDSNGTIYEVTN